MPKLCNYTNCKYNQFGGGYCRNHQWNRTDKKNKPLKRTAIRKISSKKQKTLGEERKQLHKDWLFFLEIWEEREHICKNCGYFLGNEPLTLFFDHLLEKSKYPDLRYEKENIMLLCWQCHSAKTNGFISDIIKQFIMKICDKFDKVRNFL